MVSQEIVIKAPQKLCYQVITDYKKYPQFLSDLKSVSVKKKGTTHEITYTINVIKDITYTLKMQGTPDSRVEWTLVEGAYMRDNHGFWDLKEIKKGVTRATYNIEIKFGLLVPGAVTKILVGQHLPKMLAEFKKRIETL